MVGRFQGKPAPRIRDLFHYVLETTMRTENIAPLQQRPSHVVTTDASFEEVVQHTDWFCWRADRVESRPYRYRRYREIFGHLQPDPSHTRKRVSHIDIGCGAGLFSWALLDWAVDSNLAYDRIDLFGLDHSPAMIALAHWIRDNLVTDIANYPELHYETIVAMLLQELTTDHREPTDYIITLGHVLAQAHDDNAILNFTRVIVHAVSLLDDQCHCALIAVDARNWREEFVAGWNLLLDSLERASVSYDQIIVPRTPINDDGRAKFAWLFL